VTYAVLQTSQIILSCICIMCIGMATHLNRKSTCTVIETNMVILFGAYLAYFSLTNQSREVTCDFGFASGDDGGCGDWNFDDHGLLGLELLLLLPLTSSSIIERVLLSFDSLLSDQS